MKNKILFGAVLAVAASSCAKIDDMHNKTTEVAATSKDLLVTSNKMKLRIDDTYADMRIGSTRQAREEALLGMDQFKDIGAKLGYASEYYAAQEFQFWKPKLETTDARLELMDIAVQDYFHKVREYINDRNNISPQGTDNDSQNLYAMAGAMHFVNPAQTTALKGSTEPVVTMYSMIEDGLKAKKQIQSGELDETQIPAYQKQVLIFEQDAIYMLQVRQNFLKGFAFVLMASNEVGDQPTKWDSIKKLISVKLGNSWTPNFDKRNIVQINFDAEVLEYAADTIRVLRMAGTPIRTDSQVQALISSANLSAFSTSAANSNIKVKPGILAFEKAVKRVSAALDKVATK